LDEVDSDLKISGCIERLKGFHEFLKKATHFAALPLL